MSGFLVNKGLLDPTVTQYSGGTASFTLPQSGSTNATEVLVGGVPQVPGVDFNVAGTALTLTTSAPAGSNMVLARQFFSDGITGTPGANTVATAAVQNDAIDGTKTKDALIADYSDVTITAADLLMYGDATDSNNTKRDTVQGVLDLVPSAGFTLSAEQATTSGSSIVFGSIPAGTKMIIVNLFGVSTNGTGGCGIELGDAGGLEQSGYVGRSTVAGGGTTVNFTDHFECTFLNAADEWYGQFVLTLEDSSNFAWLCTFQLGRYQQDVWDGGGGKTLSAELTQVALRTDNTFDSGAASILYI